MEQSPAQQWNERYGAPEWAYGTEPNRYFAEKLAQMSPGSILLPAEGEGRNAIFAAEKGWDVTAFDIAVEGKNKAYGLAAERGLHIDYQVKSITEVDYPKSHFDALGLIYNHFPSALREAQVPRLLEFIKPGGHVILECFGKRQLEYQPNHASGGPKDAAMLYDMDEVRSLFRDFDVLELLEGEVFLSEGLYHRGQGWVVRFWGRKR